LCIEGPMTNTVEAPTASPVRKPKTWLDPQINKFIPSPEKAILLWLAVYAHEGGLLRRSQRDDFKFNNGHFETPTVDSSCFIPKLFEPAAQQLLIMENVTPSVKFTPQTRKEGSEYGHTQVYTLQLQDGVLTAKTNNSYVSISYPEAQMLAQADIRALTKSMLGRFGQVDQVKLEPLTKHTQLMFTESHTKKFNPGVVDEGDLESRIRRNSWFSG